MGLDEFTGHPGAAAGLANENHIFFVEVGEPGFNLIHGNIDGTRNVSGGELAGITYINKLRLAGCLLEIIELFEGDVHFLCCKGRVAVGEKGFWESGLFENEFLCEHENASEEDEIAEGGLKFLGIDF